MSEKNKRSLEATKLALIEAACKLMKECSDPNEVTSRAIARESGANQAMINYCFGSREGLLYEVFRQMLAEAQSAAPQLNTALLAELSPKQRLIELHFCMMKLMIANYNISKAVTSFILLNRNAEFGMESLPLVSEHFAGRKSDGECRLITSELTSLHELAVLRHKEIKQETGLDLTDDEALRSYVTSSVGRYLDEE